MADLKAKKIAAGSTVSNNSRGGYYSEVTLTRGMALILVILGHSFPDGDIGVQNFGGLWIRTWLYSFHMGVFFALSGFVMAQRLYSGGYSLLNESVKRGARLLIPYFFYSLLTIVPKIVLSAYVYNPYDINELWTLLIGNSPNGGMWFLWNLFVITIFFLLLFKITKNLRAGLKSMTVLAVGLVMYCLYIVLDMNFLSFVLEYAVFFAIGVVGNHYYESIRKYFRPLIACICMIITVAAACPALDFKLTYLFSGILGLYGLYTAAIYLDENSGVFSKLFSWLGIQSYEIYLLSYFIQIPIRIVAYIKFGLPYAICVTGMFLGGLFIPTIVSRIIGKSKVLSVLLLGRGIKSDNRLNLLRMKP